MFKFLVFVLCLFLFVNSQIDPTLDKCLRDRCSTEYAKCEATSGCKAKMEKCLNQCGAKINQTCWTFCIGTPGAAANLANCAVNQKCITNVSIYELVKEFLDAVRSD